MRSSAFRHGLLLLLLAGPTASAQWFQPSRLEAGVHLGSFLYQGDLTPSFLGSFRTPAPSAGISLGYHLLPNLTLRAGLGTGSLRGSDSLFSTPAWRKERSFGFTASVTELSLGLLYFPLGREERLSPYLTAGAGLALVQVRRDYSAFNADYFAGAGVAEGLAQDLQQSLPRRLAILPVGAGLRYRLNERWSLGGEASYRLMATDYLDGFSQAANPSRNDHYYQFAVGLLFQFGRRGGIDCPRAD